MLDYDAEGHECKSCCKSDAVGRNVSELECSIAQLTLDEFCGVGCAYAHCCHDQEQEHVFEECRLPEPYAHV